MNIIGINKLIKNAGMSLLDVIMALSVLGIVALGIMHLSKSTTDMQTRNYISVDYATLADEFYFYLMKKDECTLSLKNTEIRQSDPSFINQAQDPTGGVEVELKVADPANPNGRVKLSSSAPNNRYGKIYIMGIRFSMPDLVLNNLVFDIPPSRGQFQGVVTIYTQAMNGTTTNNLGNSVADIYKLPPIKKNVIVQYFNNGATVLVEECITLNELGL